MLCIIFMSAALKSLVEAGSIADGIMSCIIFCIAAGSMWPMGMAPDIGMLPWPWCEVCAYATPAMAVIAKAARVFIVFSLLQGVLVVYETGLYAVTVRHGGPGNPAGTLPGRA